MEMISFLVLGLCSFLGSVGIPTHRPLAPVTTILGAGRSILCTPGDDSDAGEAVMAGGFGYMHLVSSAVEVWHEMTSWANLLDWQR
jgi:hypothetical protein